VSSLFGKLPAALDFVRVHHDRAESIELDRWLQASLQRLAARGESWPQTCLRFVSVVQSGYTRRALIGVVSASRDRAGRRFPIAVYACLAPDALGAFAAALPLAAERYARDAEQLLEDARELSVPELAAALQRLSGPRAEELSAARAELHAQLTKQTLADYVGRVFEDVPLAMASEAFQRLLHASPRDARTFDCYDCPVVSSLDVATWSRVLELSEASHWSCLWNVTSDSRPRALLARTALPERGPLCWATPSDKHPQLCRLDQGAVNVNGRLSYAPESGSETLAALFERLLRECPL
jgi:type VI secretion system protein ImpM